MTSNVVLDTNIYRKNPSRSDLAFRALRRLCHGGALRLHIPHVVRREFETQQRAAYAGHVDSAAREIASVLRKGLSPVGLGVATAIKNQIDAASETIVVDAEQSLVRWGQEFGATFPALTETQVGRALTSYFLGTPPFVEPKNRADLPDAFVFEQIRDIAGDDQLYVVTEDARLATAVAELPNTTVFASLADLIQEPGIQELLADLPTEYDLAHMRNILEAYEDMSYGISAPLVEPSLEALIGRTISSPSIPDDNNEATIFAYGDGSDLSLDFPSLEYFGDGEYGLQFTLTADVNADFYIFKPDYYVLDREYSVSDHNDHYFSAEDEFQVHIVGVAKITVPIDDLVDLTADNAGEYISLSVEEIVAIEVIDPDA